MRSAKRWRYYCDFCRKVGGSSFHMTRHESGCTANPNRICRMHVIMGKPQPDMLELFAVLDDETLSDPLTDLVAAADACPACILAALRQSDSQLQFEFKEACKAFWEKMQREQRTHRRLALVPNMSSANG